MSTILKPSQRLRKSLKELLDALASDKSRELPKVIVRGRVIEMSKDFEKLLGAFAQEVSKSEAITLAGSDEILTSQQAADYLGCSRPTLVKLLDQHGIPYTKINRHRKIRLEELETLRQVIKRDQLRAITNLRTLESKLGTSNAK